MTNNISYEAAGVNIDTANDTKEKFKEIVSSPDQSISHCKPLNKVGAFASLVEIGLKDYKEPVFVLKTEEPGSKQLLSINNDKIEWIARDLINHLIDDIIVMGAAPCAVLDTIICGKFEKDTILKLVGEISKACAENGCLLVGGETSEQPGVLLEGRYVLQASVLGIVEKSKIIDGAKIKCGDVLIALASNGLHTNGYSLVRKLMESHPEILDEKIAPCHCGLDPQSCEMPEQIRHDGETQSFLHAILQPHTSYANAVKNILGKYTESIHGMAHITGGGIYDNLSRIIHSEDLQANVDLSKIKIPPVFGVIKKYANVGDDEMLKTFNCGVGIIVVADEKDADGTIDAVKSVGIDAYRIGEVGDACLNILRKVNLYGKLNWGI